MIPALDIPDALIDAALLEPASRYWADSAEWEPKRRRGHVIEHEGKVRHELTERAICRGLQLMALQVPQRFGALLAADLDGEGADIFLQLCCFPRIKYG